MKFQLSFLTLAALTSAKPHRFHGFKGSSINANTFQNGIGNSSATAINSAGWNRNINVNTFQNGIGNSSSTAVNSGSFW